jgi:hypothetical protein
MKMDRKELLKLNKDIIRKEVLKQILDNDPELKEEDPETYNEITEELSNKDINIKRIVEICQEQAWDLESFFLLITDELLGEGLDTDHWDT